MFKINNSIVSALVVGAVLGLGACSDDNFVGEQRVNNSTTGSIVDGDLRLVASREDYAVAGSVTIPKGTRIFDANGNELDGSRVDLVLHVYDGTPVSESFFDGGVEFVDPPIAAALGSALLKKIDASRSVTLDLLGFSRVRASVNGVPIKRFSPAITMVVRLRDVAPGTALAKLSVDEVTIERLFEGLDSVDQNGNVSFSTDHLTAFGLVGNVKNTPRPQPTATPATGATGSTGSTGATGGQG